MQESDKPMQEQNLPSMIQPKSDVGVFMEGGERILERVKELQIISSKTQEKSIESQQKVSLEQIASNERIVTQKQEQEHKENMEEYKIVSEAVKSENRTTNIVTIGIIVIAAGSSSVLFATNNTQLAYQVVTSSVTGIFGWLAGRNTRQNADKP